MSLPGEEHAHWVIYSPSTSASDKAEAATKLAEIDEIRRGNAERDRQYQVRKGTCPTCGRRG